jgi:hypothetical protein
MANDLEILKDIGAQKIHNDTHIAKEHIQEILHETFDSLNSVQFMGFISILEREYNIDLSELRQKGKNYYAEIEANLTQPHKVFVVTKKKKSNKSIFLILVTLIVAAFAYYLYVYLSSINYDGVVIVDNSKIKTAQENISSISDNNISQTQELNSTLIEDKVEVEDTNLTIKTSEDEPIQEEVVEVNRELKIIPKHKLWAGYIDIKTNKHYQNIYRKEVVLDTDKNWLLLFGSGSIKLNVNGEIKKFSSKENMRFKYVDGVLEKITVEEFKALNKGRKW